MISRAIFLDVGSILFPKPNQNEGSQEHFFDLVTNMWKVWFGTTLLSFCYIFRLGKHRISTLKGLFFSCFFESVFKTYFLGFGMVFFVEIGGHMGARIDEKIYENLSWFFNEILMDFRSPWGVPNGKCRGGVAGFWRALGPYSIQLADCSSLWKHENSKILNSKASIRLFTAGHVQCSSQPGGP